MDFRYSTSAQRCSSLSKGPTMPFPRGPSWKECPLAEFAGNGKRPKGKELRLGTDMRLRRQPHEDEAFPVFVRFGPTVGPGVVAACAVFHEQCLAHLCLVPVNCTYEILSPPARDVTTPSWTVKVSRHLVGMMGQPRRMAYYDFSNPALASQGVWVTVSAIGGFVLVFSAALFIGVLLASHRGPTAAISPLKFSLAVNPPRRLPKSLNSFGIWAALVLALTVAKSHHRRPDLLR